MPRLAASARHPGLHRRSRTGCSPGRAFARQDGVHRARAEWVWMPIAGVWRYPATA
jgi:hypothetical protein